jgi:hypothetical protein
VPTGRRDGTVSSMQEALDEIPKPSMSFKQLTDLFATKGLGVRDLVWLSGTPYMMTDHITRQDCTHVCCTTQHMDPSLAKRKLVRTKKKPGSSRSVFVQNT